MAFYSIVCCINIKDLMVIYSSIYIRSRHYHIIFFFKYGNCIAQMCKFFNFKSWKKM
jgi:hypothetical protein